MLIDSVKPPRKPRPLRPRPHIQPTGARFTKLERSKPHVSRRIQWGLVGPILASPTLFGLAIVGMLSAVLIVLLYGIVCVIVRLQSRISFILALAALVFIVVLQLSGKQGTASTMATIAYELLAIGVISFALETRRENKIWFRK